jgi:hypothetical protein
MKVLKQYWIVILIILLTGLLICIKSFSHNIFRYDATQHAASSVSGENLISPYQMNKLDDAILIINLDGKKEINDPSLKQMSIPADSILQKANKALIFRHKGSIVLRSQDQSEAAAVWMVLSQMGLNRLFILSN